MTHRGWLLGVLALLVSASLAGCLGGEDDPETTDTTDDSGDSGDDATGDDGGNDTSDDGTTDVGDNVTTAAPTAVITVTGNTTVAPTEAVTFDATSSTDDDTTLENLSFAWDFGDGETGEGSNVTHPFATEGNFTVNLTVTDPEGNIGMANTTIVVVSGFADTVIGELAGTITLPNPIVHNGAALYGPAGAACGGTQLECYKTVGGQEGTTYDLHTVEVPAGPAVIRFEAGDLGAAGTLTIAVFAADGTRLGASSVGASTTPPVVVLSDPTAWGDALTVFVNSGIAPNVAYTITVTALAEAP